MPLGAAAIIALAGTAATGAATIYSTRQAGNINKRAIEAQSRAEAEAAAYERSKLESDERARQEQLAFDRESREAKLAYDRERLAFMKDAYDKNIAARAPYFQFGNKVLGSLAGLAGLATPEDLPTAPAPMPTGGGTGAGLSLGSLASMVSDGEPSLPPSGAELSSMPSTARPAANRGRQMAARFATVPMPTGASLADMLKMAAGIADGAKLPAKPLPSSYAALPR